MKTIYYFLSALVITTSALAQDSALTTDKLIETYYEPKIGYAIDQSEQDTIVGKGSSPTYGEITPEGAVMLIKEYNLNNNDVFYDLGCGVGKLVFQVFLESDVKKSAGIELSPTRINYANKVKEQIKKQLSPANGRTIDFYEQNILDAPVDDATAIYVASTCFSDDFMTKLAQKLSELKPGLRLVTLTQLPDLCKFKFVKQMTIPMSWSPNTTAYFYTLPTATDKL